MFEENRGQVIFHVDVNSAFLSWEAAYGMGHLGEERDLRQIPSAVGGDMAKRHGIILAKSIPAKKQGVQTGESIPEALAKCPGLVLVPPRYGLYEKASSALMEILKKYSPQVEQYSIDEAFLDMTGTGELWGPPLEAAKRLREEVLAQLGFTVNVGVSGNKLLAKMASDFQKPNQVHTLWKHEVEEKMWPLPVEELFFVGRATGRKLRTLGVKTIGQLARMDVGILKRHFKKHGQVIWNYANGHDLSLVQAEVETNKSYGCSTTLPFDVTELSMAKLALLSLAETGGARLRQDGVKAGLVALGIKDWEFRCLSRQKTLPDATDLTMEIHKAACCLLDQAWDGTPIRHLGIGLGKIGRQDHARQLNLFPQVNVEKLEALDQAVDRIRGQFGKDSVKRAVFLGLGIPHMAGGVQEEKGKEGGGRVVQGKLVEVACDCYFSRSGRPFVRFFKYQDEKGEIRTIGDVKMVWVEDKRHAGVASKECLCRILADGREQEVRLVFALEECRWYMAV